MAKVLFLTVLLGLLLFVGCAVTETAVVPTGTAVLTVESVDTPTPQPTATTQPTAVPTSTSLPTATNTPTSTPTHTPLPTPTPTVRIDATLVSPSGEWRAVVEIIRSNSVRTTTIKATKTDESLEWIIESIIGDAMLVSEPHPLGWSKDEQYLYFTHSSSGDGCMPGGNGSDFHQFDLINGTKQEITAEGYWYAVSPDGTKFAFLSRERGLVMHNLESGEEVEAQFDIEPLYPSLFMSDLVWSPNSNALLVTAFINVCEVVFPTFSLILVDTKTFEQTTLIHENDDLPRINIWTEPERALLNFQNELMWINIVTGELTPAEE